MLFCLVVSFYLSFDTHQTSGPPETGHGCLLLADLSAISNAPSGPICRRGSLRFNGIREADEIKAADRIIK